MRRSASSSEKPNILSAPRPPALLTAAARAGLLSPPIGACRMGHFRFSFSVSAFLDHMPLLLTEGVHQTECLCRLKGAHLAAAGRGSRDRGSVARTLAAIDVNGLARHEARRFQIEDRAYDLRDLAHPAKRVHLGEVRMRFDGMHWRLDDAGRNSIHSDAELCILDCE